MMKLLFLSEKGSGLLLEWYLLALSTLAVLVVLMVSLMKCLIIEHMPFCHESIPLWDRMAKSILKYIFFIILFISIGYVIIPSDDVVFRFGQAGISKLKSSIYLFILLIGSMVLAYFAFFTCIGIIEGILGILNGNISFEDREKYRNISRIDGMSGLQFELFCEELLRYNGFSEIKLTPASGDQGVDITARKANVRYAFQCKHYKKSVGNRAVQEVYTGKAYYGCSIGVVITNSHFTPKAREIAKKTHTILWERKQLQELMERAAKAKYP